MKKSLLRIITLIWVAVLVVQGSAAETPILQFGVIADAQYAYYPEENPNYERYYRHSIRKMDECVTTFNERNLDFVVSLGDFIDHNNITDHQDEVHCIKDKNGLVRNYFYELANGYVSECDENGNYTIVEDLKGFDELKAKKYHVLGNHDYVSNYWFNNWKDDPNNNYYSRDVRKEQITDYKLEYRYYSYVMEKGTVSFRFIVLDGCEKDDSENDIKSYPGNLYKILQPQVDWFDNELKEAENKLQNVIVFCHMGFYYKGPEADHKLSAASQERLKTVMAKYPPVIAWMHGHCHDGDFYVNTDVPFYNFKGMIQGSFDEGHNAYSIVKIYQNRLDVEKFGDEIDSKIPVSRSIELVQNVRTVEKRIGGNIEGHFLNVTINEVTLKEYADIMGFYPYGSTYADAGYPVRYIGFHDAIMYCNKKSKQNGLDTVYTWDNCSSYYNYVVLTNLAADSSKNGYRLPCEEEWRKLYLGGTDPDANYGYYWTEGAPYDYAWYRDNSNDVNSGMQKKPNGYGIYDIAGNLEEMICEYNGTLRIGIAGGCYLNGCNDRLSCNSPIEWSRCASWLGFRTVRNVPPDMTPVNMLLLD